MAVILEYLRQSVNNGDLITRGWLADGSKEKAASAHTGSTSRDGGMPAAILSLFPAPPIMVFKLPGRVFARSYRR
jgi:hypothetical protein